MALLLDTVLGEPPAELHPVVWMGRLLDALESRAPHASAARLTYGGCVGMLVPLAWATLACLQERWVPWQLHALVLKPTFAGRALLDSAHSVELALLAEDLPAARLRLHALVSRPTQRLDGALAAAAAIESLAENLVDSWLAPLLAYSAFGLGGAYAYRAANTADAMWGYHTHKFEHLGKVAARLDDALNFGVARLGALIIASVAGERCLAALRSWWHDRARTSSPNAGQTMACAAGALGVRLEKQGQYVLNRGAPLPDTTSIARARVLIRRAMWFSAAIAIVLSLLRQD